MPSIVERLPSGARVLIVRLRSLGDCILTTPALQLLHAHRPDLEIGVMVEDRFSQIFQGDPAVTDILPPTVSTAVGYGAALTLNLHGGTRSTVLSALSMAQWRAGFGHYRQQWVYNVSIPRAQEILGEERTVHTAEHIASAMFYLGVPRTEIPQAKLYADQRPPSGGYAIIHPVASEPGKEWPQERFIEIAHWLHNERGLTPIVIGGPDEDLYEFADFEQRVGAPLREVKVLMSGATLFIGNDSGPAHMAAAFGVPVVTLYGTSDPLIWAPWRTIHEVVHEPGGLATVSVERVREAADRVLGASR